MKKRPLGFRTGLAMTVPAALLALTLGNAACAQTQTPGVGPSAQPERPGADPAAIAAQDARLEAWRREPYAGSGPYPATRSTAPALPGHTLYHPRDLSAAGPLPILIFANGGCRNTSIEFARFLGEVASQGYLVVAVGRDDVPFYPNSQASRPPAEPAPGALPVQIRDPAVLIAGLEWALAENVRAGSPFQGRLATDKIAAIGQSCGGAQAFAAARDPRIAAVVALNSHLPFVGDPLAMMNPAPGWDLSQYRKPMAIFVGGEGDVATVNAERAFETAPSDADLTFADNALVGHTGAYPQPDANWSRTVIGWLDWRLKDSDAGRRLFEGDDCGLCRGSPWVIRTKRHN